jgi:uncharacterized repeat protein (TIGR03809 family)
MHMSLHLAPSDLLPSRFSDLKTLQIARRWTALAEQRLTYLTELYDSGRWRRFHGEREFLDNIQEAKDALERWRAMAKGEYVAPVIRTVAKPAVAVAVAPAAMAPVTVAPVAPLVPELPAAVVVSEEPEVVVSFEQHAQQREAARTKQQLTAVKEALEQFDAAQPEPRAALDLFDRDAIIERYPMLRAAM